MQEVDREDIIEVRTGKEVLCCGTDGGSMVTIDCLDISRLSKEQYDALYRQASEERKKRADRCLRYEDKLRCICAGALLARAVGETLHLSEFSVVYREEGKPYLADSLDFHFNLSHSGRWVVLAYGASPLGVDVQEIRPVGNVARRFFTADERDYVSEDPQRFFRVWTGKESYLKYLGLGLKKPLDSFSVLEDVGVNLFSRQLEGAYLTLCTEETEYVLNLLDTL